MLRVVNDSLGRALHAMLYDRLITFCTQYTPEFLCEPIVHAWLDRMYAGDPSLHILVELNSAYAITWHAVVDVQTLHGASIVMCHQVQSDKANMQKLDELAEYVDKLVHTSNALCSIVYVTKNSKVLEKKYGYTVSRIAMVKSFGGDSDIVVNSNG